MNSSVSMETQASDIQQPQDINVNVSGENLGTISVFVSAVLLSLGGFIAIVMQNVRKSRCTSISCGISKCSRKLPDDDDDDKEDRPSDLKV
jgi:hypothetical protein